MSHHLLNLKGSPVNEALFTSATDLTIAFKRQPAASQLLLYLRGVQLLDVEGVKRVEHKLLNIRGGPWLIP